MRGSLSCSFARLHVREDKSTVMASFVAGISLDEAQRSSGEFLLRPDLFHSD